MEVIQIIVNSFLSYLNNISFGIKLSQILILFTIILVTILFNSIIANFIVNRLKGFVKKQAMK